RLGPSVASSPSTLAKVCPKEISMRFIRTHRNRQLLTVSKFCPQHKALTPGSIRWLSVHRYTNALAERCQTVERSILIDLDLLFQWSDENGRPEDTTEKKVRGTPPL